MDEFYSSACSSHFDFIAITETWLSSDILSSEYFPNNFNVIRSDRRFQQIGRSRGGGVLLAIRNFFDYTIVDTTAIFQDFPAIDIIVVKTTINSTLLHICVLYIPPDISLLDFESFLDIFEQKLLDFKDMIILGDFNCPHFMIDDRDPKSINLRNCVELLALEQFNHVTNVNGRILDLVLSNSPCEVLRDAAPFVGEDEYHPALTISVAKTSERYVNFPTHDAPSYNFKKSDFPSLYDCLLNANWSFLDGYTDVDTACDSFYQRLYSIFNMYVPTTSTRKNCYPKWFTPEIIYYAKLKHTHWKNYKRHKSTYSLNEFRRLRALIKSLCSVAYSNYMSSVETNIINNPKDFWAYINTKKQRTRIPGRMTDGDRTMDDPQSIVDGFASFFKSVYVSPSLNTDDHDEVDVHHCVHLVCFSEDDVKCYNKTKRQYDCRTG